ncbi:MAG: DUF1320 family protein [Treponema sp.]|nr:DUF1320 family protein [Treponema sp.]
MKPMLSAEQFISQCSRDMILPSNDDGDVDTVKIETALRGASGVIVARLPWLLNANGEIAEPIPAQFADALLAMCFDFTVYRLTDGVSGSENARNKYNDNMRLLETIDKEYKGGLSGPDNQSAFIVEPNESEGISDRRFWKKGGLV